MRPLVSLPGRVADVCTADDDNEQKDLDHHPGPAAALLVLLNLLRLLALGLVSLLVVLAAAGLGRVKVLGADGDDIVVVAQLTSLGGESQVRDLWDRGRLVCLEARSPLAIRLVMQLQLEGLVLEVGKAELCRNAGVSDSAGRAARKLVALSISVLVVCRVSVTNHGHDVGEDHARAVVLVGIEEETQTLKFVGVAKYRANIVAPFSHPHGEAVTVKLVLAVYLKLDLNFPVCCCQWYARPQGAHL